MRKLRALTLAIAFPLAFAACGQSDPDPNASPASADEPSSTPTSEAAATPDSAAAPNAPRAAADVGSPADAAKAWTTSLGEGDLDRAWALTADRSRTAIGGRDKFAAMRTELREGWGAWSRGTGVRYTAVRLPGGPAEETRSVVVLDGTVAREGAPRRTTAALIVRTANGASMVDPFVDLGEIEFAPESGSTITSQPTFEAYVPAARSLWFLVDTRGPERPAVQGVDGDRQRARLEIGPSLEPGHHSLAVVLERNGALAVGTATYRVGSAPAGTHRCGTVSFTPNSEDAASNIQATGLDCDEAKAFVQVAGRHTSSGGPEQVTVEGYRCTRTAVVEDPLPRSSYDCRQGDKRVTFDRT